MPYYKGLKALGLYIRNITKEDRQRERNEILSTNVETIKSYSDIIAKAMEQDYLAVVGNEKEIKDNENLFNNLINVFK
jgi:Zn-dependent M16 (insulinase) family peptidase